jgi:3-dehydroquinate synthase
MTSPLNVHHDVAPLNQGCKTLSVALSGKSHSYPISIGSIGTHSLSQLGGWLQTVTTLKPTGKVLIVTDETVGALYAQFITASIKESYPSATLQLLSLPAGESAKQLDTLTTILTAAQALSLTRSDLLIALGGGVIGDMAGFAASIYYRGVPFVQVPTTLLAMVDSSVGGKVAINFKEVKNGLGQFYQPIGVFIDVATLETLPQREQLAGLAEIVKYGLIERSALGLSVLDTNQPSSQLSASSFWENLATLDSNWREAIVDLIASSCYIKAQVVMRDEQELAPATDATGRVCLNLGHTFAHAYEAALGYGTLLHGEAVAIGLMQATWLSETLGLLNQSTVKTIETLMNALNLYPITLPNHVAKPPCPEQLLQLMGKDKKVTTTGKLRLVLPVEPLGTVVVQEGVPIEAVKQVLLRYF